MTIEVHLGLASVASPLEVGASEAATLLAQAERLFEQAQYPGLKIHVFKDPLTSPALAEAAGRFFYDQRIDVLCIVASSWFEDYLVLDLLEECAVPVVCWAHPGMETGSICGMQQLTFMLKALQHPYFFVFDDLSSSQSAHQAWEFISAASVRRQLRRARLGYLGHRVEGMTETTAHELALKKVFGPRVVAIDTQVFLDSASRVPPEMVEDLWEDLKSQVGRVLVSEDAGIESLRFYHALRQVVEGMGLAAVAVGCYPHLMGKVCLSASFLGEAGIPVACEGDVNGALGMLILTRLTRQPVHNTDMLDPIPRENAIVFSHCGSGGFSLATSASSITLGPVRLMDRGLCCLFPARPGPVTLLNLTPKLDGYRMAALYGEAVETDMVFPGNPLRVRFASNYRNILAWIADEGLVHHWMAAYGDLRPALGHLAKMVGCDWLSHA